MQNNRCENVMFCYYLLKSKLYVAKFFTCMHSNYFLLPIYYTLICQVYQITIRQRLSCSFVPTKEPKPLVTVLFSAFGIKFAYGSSGLHPSSTQDSPYSLYFVCSLNFSCASRRSDDLWNIFGEFKCEILESYFMNLESIVFELISLD